MWKFIENGNKLRIGGSHSESSMVVMHLFFPDLSLQNYSGKMAITVFIVAESSAPHKR